MPEWLYKMTGKSLVHKEELLLRKYHRYNRQFAFLQERIQS